MHNLLFLYFINSDHKDPENTKHTRARAAGARENNGQV